MDFALTEDQVMFKGTIRKLFDQFEHTNIIRQYKAGSEQAVNTVAQKLVDLGATAIAIPEEYDGLELGVLDLVPVLEEMGHSLYPSNYAETVTFAAKIIGKFGKGKLKEEFLPQIATGESIFSIAWLEYGKSYQSEQLDSIVKEVGGHYHLCATKTIVPVQGVTHCIVVAHNEKGEKVLVIAERAKAKERQQHSFDVTTPVAELSWENVEIPSEYVISAPEALCYGLRHLHVAISIIQVGAMERIVNMTSEYAKTREQFGQAIGRFQAVKHRLADMKVTLEIARSLSYYACWAVDTNAEDLEEAVYSARAYCTEAFMQLAEQSVQLHGGIGFTEELDCHFYVKRSRFYEHYLGSIFEYREKIAAALGL